VRLSPSHIDRTLFHRHLLSLSMILISVKKLSKREGPVRTEGSGAFIKLSYFFGSRVRHLPAISIVPLPLCYHVPHTHIYIYICVCVAALSVVTELIIHCHVCKVFVSVFSLNGRKKHGIVLLSMECPC
jgi:hypothetical protein